MGGVPVPEAASLPTRTFATAAEIVPRENWAPNVIRELAEAATDQPERRRDSTSNGDTYQTVVTDSRGRRRESWLKLGPGSERPGQISIATITVSKCRADGDEMGGGGGGDDSLGYRRRPSFIPGYDKPFPRVTIV